MAIKLTSAGDDDEFVDISKKLLVQMINEINRLSAKVDGATGFATNSPTKLSIAKAGPTRQHRPAEATDDWKLFAIFDTYPGQGFYQAHAINKPTADIDPNIAISLAALGEADTSVTVCIANIWEIAEPLGKLSPVWAKFWYRNSDGLDVYLTQTAELYLCGS